MSKISDIGKWFAEFKVAIVSIAAVVMLLAGYFKQIQDWNYKRQLRAQNAQTTEIVQQVTDSILVLLSGEFITQKQVLEIEKKLDSNNQKRWNFAIDSLAVPALSDLQSLKRSVKQNTIQLSKIKEHYEDAAKAHNTADKELIYALQRRIEQDSIRHQLLIEQTQEMREAMKRFEYLRQ